MCFKKVLLILSLFVSTSVFAESQSECQSAYMLIIVNKDAVTTKDGILEALRMIYSRKPDVLVRDAFMKGDELFYVVMTQEEVKQKKILPDVREIVAERYRAIRGINVETCHFRQEVSITGSN